MSWLADLLRSSSVKNLDVDGVDRFKVHSFILEQKPMLKKVFTEFHHAFNRLDKKFLSGSGSRIEIGAGVAPIRDSYSDVLATDIVPGPGLDFILNAENINLPNNSVRALFGQNCFHHLSQPRLFFKELERVLEPGGGAILLEPYHGPFASLIFRRMFHTEGYDKNYPYWETPISGPMNGANQALSYIVFKRDRVEFERDFPSLQVIHEETSKTYLLYLFSGGLNFRQIWPNWAIPLLRLIQNMLWPLDRLLALHHIVVIKKKN